MLCKSKLLRQGSLRTGVLHRVVVIWIPIRSKLQFCQVLGISYYGVLGLNWLLDPLLTIHDMDSGREKLIWIAILSPFLPWGAAKIDRKRLIVPFWKDLSLSIDILSAPEIPW